MLKIEFYTNDEFNPFGQQLWTRVETAYLLTIRQ